VIATVTAGGATFAASSKLIDATGFVGVGGFSYSTGVKIIVGSAQTASGVSTVALLAPPSLSDIILIAGRWLIATPLKGIVVSQVAISGADEGQELSAFHSGDVTLGGSANSSASITGRRKRS
jgi:hypothetical protein